MFQNFKNILRTLPRQRQTDIHYLIKFAVPNYGTCVLEVKVVRGKKVNVMDVVWKEKANSKLYYVVKKNQYTFCMLALIVVQSYMKIYVDLWVVICIIFSRQKNAPILFLDSIKLRIENEFLLNLTSNFLRFLYKKGNKTACCIDRQ